MGEWTRACCLPCWNSRHSDKGKPVRLREEFRAIEHCGYCGEETMSGIYVRIDPKEQHAS